MSKRLESIRVSLDTLGCKLNQAETEFLAGKFAQAGYRLVSAADQADVYILNTCTVTHIADRKSRHLLRLTHRRNPDAVIVATGCYAQRAPEELAQLDGVSLVLGNDDKMYLPQLLEELGYLSRLGCGQGELSHYDGFRTRAFIRVQDGCNNFCAYCIVPLVRGRQRSLSAEQVVSEVRAKVAQGCKEVVLTGTEIGSYHYNGLNLRDLVDIILSKTDVMQPS